MKLFIREMQKAILQYVILPFAYWIFCYQKIDENLVVFADSRDEEINYNSYSMYNEVKKRGYNVELYLYNFDKLSMLQKLWKSIMFMKLYARAKYVFIYNYYLPVSSCYKRKRTKVIQLWHASGLQKKFGYDAIDDLGCLKFVRPTKNYNLAPVSSEIVRNVVMNNWQLVKSQVVPLGNSRTDILYNKEYLDKCKSEFYEKYPQAKDKKVVLWAPSFRGSDLNSELSFVDDVISTMQHLPDDYFFIIKLHPHLQIKTQYDNCSIATDRLNGVVDLLITDYSSVFYDYLINNTQTIFFVPDYQEYKNERGLYIEYKDEFKFPIIENIDELLNAVLDYKSLSVAELEKYKDKFIKFNDGLASARTMDALEQK